MADSTWEDRELPILEAMFRAMEKGGQVDQAARQAVPELSDAVYVETIAALADDRFLEAEVTYSFGDEGFALPTRLLPKGRRPVRQWPSGDPVDQLERVLARLEIAETDPERKRAGSDGYEKRSATSGRTSSPGPWLS
jgi:hypothetical protein